jgi:hypothetical protein
VKSRKHYIIYFSAIVAVSGFLFVTGCQPSTQGLFAKPAMTMYHRMAVLGLNLDQEQIYMASYLKTFPEQNPTFVERSEIAKILGEQNVLEGRLNEKTRAKLQEILGVQALIICNYSEAAEGSLQKKLRIRIVDSETGAIVGSVITKAQDNFTYHCYTANRSLKSDLNGSPFRAYQPTASNRYHRKPM